jgi:hypothetical protein
MFVVQLRLCASPSMTLNKLIIFIESIADVMPLEGVTKIRKLLSFCL